LGKQVFQARVRALGCLVEEKLEESLVKLKLLAEEKLEESMVRLKLLLEEDGWILGEVGFESC
jgi:hypothetical protein